MKDRDVPFERKAASLPLFLAYDTCKSDLLLRVNSLGRMRIATSEDAPIF